MTVLMTGFPGFLGSALLPGILQRTDSAAICLVQPKCRPVAHVRHCRLARSAAQLCPNCGQHVAAFGVECARLRPHSKPCRFSFTLGQTRTIRAIRVEVRASLSRRP